MVTRDKLRENSCDSDLLSAQMRRIASLTPIKSVYEHPSDGSLNKISRIRLRINRRYDDFTHKTYLIIRYSLPIDD